MKKEKNKRGNKKSPWPSGPKEWNLQWCFWLGESSAFFWRLREPGNPSHCVEIMSVQEGTSTRRQISNSDSVSPSLPKDAFCPVPSQEGSTGCPGVHCQHLFSTKISRAAGGQVWKSSLEVHGRPLGPLAESFKSILEGKMGTLKLSIFSVGDQLCKHWKSTWPLSIC